MRELSLQGRRQSEAGLTNEICGDEEAIIVRELLIDGEETLSHLNSLDQIAGGQGTTYSPTRVADYIARLKAVIAPHELLPPELLAYIFLLCLGNDLATWPPKLSDPPWIFGHICSRWRNIALGEPRLWNSLRILRQDNTGPAITLQAPLNEAIARTKGIPLSLTAEGPTTTDIIVTNSQKIRFLQIKDTEPSFLISVVPFHSLESVVLQFPSFRNDLWHIASDTNITILDDAPRLRSISLCYNDDHSISLFSKSQLNVNWAQLTNLTLFQISPPLSSVLDIIRESVSLVDFYLVRRQGTFIGFDGEGANHSPLIVHQNLQTVRLGLGETNDLGFFLQPLTLPSLKSFENSGSEIFSRTILLHPELLAFITRSSQVLRHFSLSGRAEMPYMAETFGAMYGVVELHLGTGYPISASIFNLMRNGGLLPVLEVLVCETLSVCAFIDFLESRTGNLTYQGIREARITGFEMDLSAEDIELGDQRLSNIQPLLKEEGRGVTIEIYDGPMSYVLGASTEAENELFGFLGSG